MNKILAFDSIYIVNPFRKVYMTLIKKLLNSKATTSSRIVLYRLDRENILLRDERNISGMAVGVHKHHIDAMSIKFYRYLEKSIDCDALSIKNLKMYDLYTRQVKLKIASVLICAYRIRNFAIDIEKNIEVITDKQTVSILEEAFRFIDYEPKNISWKTSILLTACISINSMIMRLASLIKMLFSQCHLPKKYYHKYVDDNVPTVAISMPRRNPEDFFSTYVDELGDQFNIVLYSLGSLKKTPKGFKSMKVKRTVGVIHGILNLKNLCLSSSSYIADILLIFFNHTNLSTSIDVVDAMFTNKIDILINRLQTNVLDNYLAIKAKKRGTFILGDVMEEIFYCDSAICSSKSQHTESLKLALADEDKVTYKGSNSLIKYRLKSFRNKKDKYLHNLLGVDSQKKIIFYASDPVKEESQRYLSEKFLMDHFSNLKDFIFVLKTHPQDNGKVTNYAHIDSEAFSNLFFIGDMRQKHTMVSKQFKIFDNFDFNAALSSCDGFLTTSSSSIMQALKLGVKSGIVDKFNNGNYHYLVNYKATAQKCRKFTTLFGE